MKTTATLAECQGYSMWLFPVKNVIRGEDGVGCCVRGTEHLICRQPWWKNLVEVVLRLDCDNVSLENVLI